jgi:hypothetical protein
LAQLFLDGGIFSHKPYGCGSHSWTVVQGAEALRVVCMVCGIEEPLRIKGESRRRALSILTGAALSPAPMPLNTGGQKAISFHSTGAFHFDNDKH